MLVRMPTHEHHIIDLIRAFGRLAEPMAILQRQNERSNLNALIRPSTVTCRLPARHAETPHVALLVELAQRGIGWIPKRQNIKLCCSIL